MKAFLHERQFLKAEQKNRKLPLRDIVAEIAQKIMVAWTKGGDPTVSHTRVMQLFFAYHDKKYLSLKKSIKSKEKKSW